MVVMEWGGELSAQLLEFEVNVNVLLEMFHRN